MNLSGKKLILSSGSPRRKELLAGLGVEFEVDTGNNFEEICEEGIPNEEIPARMSEGKSFGFHRELSENELLLTSDTLVLCPGPEGSIVMGKPHDEHQAVEMLKLLSGKSHKVITAVTLRDRNSFKTVSDTAIVHFKDLSEEEIAYYVKNFRPFDKAGAYGIQEWIGYIGIDRIEGSFFTIMGLPLHIVYALLNEKLF